MPASITKGRSTFKGKQKNKMNTKDKSWSSAPPWDVNQERELVHRFARRIGRSASPTPSTSSHYRCRQRDAVQKETRLRQSYAVPSDDEVDTDESRNVAYADGLQHQVVPCDDLTPEEIEMGTAAFLFSRHGPGHDGYKLAIKLLVDQIFSDEEHDATISCRTSALIQQLLQYPHDESKVDIDFVAADLLEAARHSKAVRLGHALTDPTALHTFLRDVKEGVQPEAIKDIIRAWERDLEEMAPDATHRQVPLPLRRPLHPPSPVSIYTSSPSKEIQMGPASSVSNAQAHRNRHDSVHGHHDYIFDARHGPDNAAQVHEMSRGDREQGEEPLEPSLPSPMHEDGEQQEVVAEVKAGREPGERAVEPTSSEMNSEIERPKATGRPMRKPSETFLGRWAGGIDVFIFYASLVLGKKRCFDSDHHPAVAKRAKEVWSQLREDERDVYDELCRVLRSGDNQPMKVSVAEAEALFARQGVLAQLREPIEIKSKANAKSVGGKDFKEEPTTDPSSNPSPPGRPMMNFSTNPAKFAISSGPTPPVVRHGSSRRRQSVTPHRSAPGFSRKHGNGHAQNPYRPPLRDLKKLINITFDDDTAHASRIAFIMPTPDCPNPLRSIDATAFRMACLAAFEEDVDAARCGMLYPRVWTAQFNSPDAAAQALSRIPTIVYHDTVIIGEAFPRSTRLLQCDLAGTNLDRTKLIKAVAFAFAAGDVRLYAISEHRYQLVFTTPRFIMRLYARIPGKREKWIRFDHVDPNVPCVLCGRFHDSRVCTVAEEVHLRRHETGRVQK